MEMPTPGVGHQKMATLVGSWEGTETMHPSQWDPKGGTATGRLTYRRALNGFAVIGNYEQERNGVVSYAGHGVLTFDTDADHHVLHWFDSMGSPPEVFTGGFADGALTLSHGGPGMHARLSYDLRQAGQLHSRMEMSQDGVTWSTLFDGRYKRLT